MGTVLGPRPPVDESSEPILRSPPVVTWLILILIAVHVVSVFLTDPQYEYLLTTFALTPERFAIFGLGGGGSTSDTAMAFVPLLTYGLLHGDFVHLTANALGILIFATAVARRIGTGRFLVFTVITTIGAAIVHLLFHWGSSVPVVGASGAVSGLMGAAFRFIFIDPNPAVTPVWPPRRLPLTSRPVLLASAVWIGLNIVLGTIGFAPGGFGQSIAWEAHIGGFLTGLLIFPLFDRQRSWIS